MRRLADFPDHFLFARAAQSTQSSADVLAQAAVSFARSQQLIVVSRRLVDESRAAMHAAQVLAFVRQ
jgi:hypothetical protein